jgi:hypothetical protein
MDDLVYDLNKHDYDHLFKKKEDFRLDFIFELIKSYKVLFVDVDFDRYYLLNEHHVVKYFPQVIKIISKSNKFHFHSKIFYLHYILILINFVYSFLNSNRLIEIYSLQFLYFHINNIPITIDR